MSTSKEDFPQIKRDLIEQIQGMRADLDRIAGQQLTLSAQQERIANTIYGNNRINPPVIGHGDRLKFLEGVDEERLNNKRAWLKMAIGSFTMALGGAILWVATVLRDAFIKGH